MYEVWYFSNVYWFSTNLYFLFVFSGESRFAMLFSKEKSTGKTASLLILGNLEEVPNSNSKMALASVDGTKTGTTMYVKII